ncbi:MAG: hypothetical protein C0405_13580 [Desulfovibrio sp.]|nr:hypothetical protein [Desulfovibrio sp.]
MPTPGTTEPAAPPATMPAPPAATLEAMLRGPWYKASFRPSPSTIWRESTRAPASFCCWAMVRSAKDLSSSFTSPPCQARAMSSGNWSRRASSIP